MAMRKFSGSEIEQLFRAMDHYVTHSIRVIVIGGAAAALQYKLRDEFTKDIDTTETNVGDLQEAYRKAIAETGLQIPFGPAGVEEVPYHFADRLQRVKIRGLKHLKIFVPEIHDWILMKAARGYDVDLEMMEKVKAKNRVDLRVLIQRFKVEMTHVMKPDRVRDQFLAMVEQLFGPAEAEGADREFRRRIP
jgi:hypothetical protein